MGNLVISGGTLIDGSGTPRQQRDIVLDGDRILDVVSPGTASGDRVIDASGRVVAPGFIDVHNHSDGWLFRESNFRPKTTQGFTTEVLMADGIGYAPVSRRTAAEWLFYLRSLDGLRLQDWTGWESIDEFMTALDGHTAQNAATHVPYANLRSMACGFGPGRVDDFQMRQIHREIRIGLEAGAVGVSTGLDYIAQCRATTDELVEALSVMSRFNGLYVTHVRYKKGLLPALEEAAEIARRAGVPLHISHLKAQSPEQVEQVFEFLERTRRDVDLSFDVYPYQPGSTMLNYLLPYEVWDDGPLGAIARLRDRGIRERFAAGLEAMRLPLDRLRIAWVQSKENAHLQGKTLAEFIEESGRSQPDALLDLLIEERLSVLLVFDEGDDELVVPLLQHDLFLLGTDGIFCTDGPMHPRVYGSVGRLLGPLVRDRQLMSLENAIARMSGRSAKRFGLTDRGIIEPGRFADVVIFDPETITDRATYDDPHQTTVGIETVLVNGVTVVKDGQPLEVSSPPGKFVRACDIAM